ncbi:outer membrane protein assembly factor BamD [Sulfurovum sp. zt1-1]|uniref:Outer membrane protein assembly factor BamD n=1 Tax=Sulfurovum zhangzhouensis TaxID=3019067 RepID=A0ABT7QWL3_9BACT|nr:outer membrane protein assembly factor BamD [Sulfurovum zhangzhouensis]MDM5271233.1 outer membrane protein assembly factor BamD [Sulfurovum zhangzhouensis]
MLQMIRTIGVGMFLSFLLVGCGNDESTVEEFNKPALYWYQKIAKNISGGYLDKADAYYISLKSEHMRSPMMPAAIIMLAHAHMSKEEYLLANFYLDEYNKRYGAGSNREYIEFLKIKASFLGIKDVYKDQKLIEDTVTNAKTFINRYPGSEYQPLVNTMLVRLYMTQYLLNENIAALYDRTGKDEAAKIYRDKNKGSVVQQSDITPPEQGIIGAVFD